MMAALNGAYRDLLLYPLIGDMQVQNKSSLESQYVPVMLQN